MYINNSILKKKKKIQIWRRQSLGAVGAIKRLRYKNQSIIGVVYLILRHYAKGN